VEGVGDDGVEEGMETMGPDDEAHISILALERNGSNGVSELAN